MASTTFTNAVTLTDADWFNTVDSQIYDYTGIVPLTEPIGTNTITSGASPAQNGLTTWQVYWFIPANTNTGATTLQITGQAAKNVFNEGAACLGGELRAGVMTAVSYDGTQFNIVGPSLNITGTWTPVLTFATPGNLSVAYTTQVGGYVRRGKLATFNYNILTSTFTHSSASGFLQVTGLPFAAAGTSQEWQGSLIWAGITKASYTHVSARIIEAAAQMTFTASGSAQVLSNISAADMPTGGTVTLNGSITARIA